METKIINEIDFQEIDSSSIEKGYINNQKAIMNAEVELDVIAGTAKKTMRDILDLKVDDIVILNKKTDDLMGIRVNKVECAKGETLYVDDRLSIRMLQL